jgi:hypothetical protein
MSRFEAKLNAVLRFPLLALALWSVPREFRRGLADALRWNVEQTCRLPYRGTAIRNASVRAAHLVNHSAGLQPALG